MECRLEHRRQAFCQSDLLPLARAQAPRKLSFKAVRAPNLVLLHRTSISVAWVTELRLSKCRKKLAGHCKPSLDSISPGFQAFQTMIMAHLEHETVDMIHFLRNRLMTVSKVLCMDPLSGPLPYLFRRSSL